MATLQKSILVGYSAGMVRLNTSVNVSGSTINWSASIQEIDGSYPSKVDLYVFDTENPDLVRKYPNVGSDDSRTRNAVFSGSWTAQKTSGTVTFYWQFYGLDDSQNETVTDNATMTDTYTGATVYQPPTCSIGIYSGSPYAGKTVTLSYSCSAGVTAGTIKRYYKAANASSWTSTLLESGLTSDGTIQDTVPANYLGGKIYWRYDVSDGTNSTYSSTNTTTVTNEPVAPPAISNFDFTSPTAGSPSTVSFTITDAAGAGSYILYRESRVPNGNTWNRTIVSSSGRYSASGNQSFTDTIPSDYSGYSIRYVLAVTSSSGGTAQATTSAKTVVGTTPEPEPEPPVISNFNFNAPTAGESCDVSFIIADKAGSGTWTLYRESREPGGSSWERITIAAGRKYIFDGQGFTYSTGIPANYGGYSIRFVLDVTSDSGETASATTSAKTVEGITPEPEPITPPSVVEFDFDNPVAGSPCTVRLTISDKAASGTYKLYREYRVPGGSSWERVNVDSNGKYSFDGASFTYGNNIPQSYGGYSLRYVLAVTSSSGQTAQATTESKVVAVDASCDIVLQTPSPYAGSSVTLLCTCSGNITSGTVRRYYKAAGASSWTNTLIQSGVTSRVTISDTLPANYGGGQVFWRYEVNDGANRADTATTTVIANSAPTTPATLTVSPTSISGGSTVTVSWSASTDPDNNLSGYILEKSIDGGATWTQVYQGPALQTTDSIIFGTTRVRYRVKAYDTFGAESGYRNAPSSGGDYSISNNRAPTTPAAPITVTPASLTAGIQAVITWGASTDPDGDAFNYVLQRAVDGLTNYQTIYTGTARNYTDEVGSWSTVSYRVKAVDVHGASSGYRTANTKTVQANSATTLTVTYGGSAIADGAELGSFSEVFSLVYQVDDDNAADVLTVKEIVDGSVKKTVSNAVRNQNYTFNFRTGSAASSSYWNKVLNGSHTVVIEVSDGTATVRKAISFIKSSSGLCVITLPSAIATDQYPAVTALSISGYIPAATLADGDKFYVEVTADGTNWERCDVFREESAAVHGRKRGTTGNVNAELYGGHWLFIHKITHPGQVFNFRISIGGVSDEVTHIDSVHWAFSEEDSAAAVASAVFNGVT